MVGVGKVFPPEYSDHKAAFYADLQQCDVFILERREQAFIALDIVMPCAFIRAFIFRLVFIVYFREFHNMLRNGKIFIGIPILNRMDLLVKCLDALDYPHELVIVNNNAVDPDLHFKISELALKHNAILLNQDRNLGVSASWNLILRTAFERGYEWVFIGSNDTTLHPGSLEGG